MKRLKASPNKEQWPRQEVKTIETRKRDLVIRIADWHRIKPLAVNTRSWWRGGFSLYAGAMALATVVSGQHYFVDVLAALPFTFAVQHLASMEGFALRHFALEKASKP